MKKEKISNIIMIVISIILIIVIVKLYKVAFQSEMKLVQSNFEAKIKESKALAIMYETSAGSGEYTASDDTAWPSEGYVFNTTLSKCENGSTISYDGTNVKVLASKSDRCYVYFDKEYPLLADYIKGLYTEDGSNGLYLHDGDGDYTNVELEAGDGSYRYAGANVNNYVCFGSDEVICPVDNLYRIVAVHGDNVKLMKAEYATTEMLGGSGVGDYAMQYSETTYDTSYYTKGSVAIEDVAVYYWNNNTTSTGINHWKESLLNKTNLNENYVNYLNSIDTKWMGYIAETTWYVAGVDARHVIGTDQETGLDNNAKTTYDWEVGDNAIKGGEYTATDGSTAPAEYTDGKIGLIYASDYMYAADPEYWNLPGYTSTGTWTNQDGFYGKDYDYRKATVGNWMYLGLQEWLISRYLHNNYAFVVNIEGEVSAWGTVYNATISVRPTFNLATTVNYFRGVGTSDDPIRIS